MSSTIIDIASDLNENVPNRYSLVLEVSELAKRMLDEAREKALHDPFSVSDTSAEKVIYQALIMKASSLNLDDALIS